MRPVRFVVFLLPVFVCCGLAAAEEGRRPALSDPRARAAAVAQRRTRAEARKAEAVAFARARGLPVRWRTGRHVSEVMRLRNGRLLCYTTDNVNAAISTAADQVRNTAPYNLNGAGLIVGVWDGGWIRTNHEHFNESGVGRVTIQDSGGSVDDHATHVGGTIGGDGIQEPTAMGMAPSVDLHSYEWNTDDAEMTSAGASYAGESGKIYVSNHSYSFIAGWRQTYLDGWEWWGTQPADWGHWPDLQEPLFGQYEDETVKIDTLAHDLPYYLVFKSAGNDRNDVPALDDYIFDWQGGGPWTNYDPAHHAKGDGEYKGGYDNIVAWGTAKNIMTVGAVDDAVSGGVRSPSTGAMADFSCWGPTDDGRIKPDIVANGVGLYSSVATPNHKTYGTMSGTSMSSPNAVGSAILLQEYYEEHTSGVAMRSSTLKGLIIHTADDVGNRGPDYSYGWGLMDVKAAADVITDDTGDLASAPIIEALLADGGSDGYDITCSQYSWLRATLCWTDPPGTATTLDDDPTLKLVNDLDVVVTGPDAFECRPYVLDPAAPSALATRGENDVDNVEQVYVAGVPTAGTYTITVDHDDSLTGGEQYYSLVITTGGPEPAPTVTGITPDSAGRVIVSVTVTGTGFQQWTEVKLSKAGETDIEATGEQVSTDTIQCTLDLAGAAFGDWDVVVTNPDGQSATLTAGFTVLSSLDITVVSPASSTVSKYAKLELTVSLANVAATELYEPDPAQGGLDLSATFTAPDGLTTWSVNGYYDGSDWRVRFAPDTEGDWTFEVAATDSTGTDTWTGGTFTCVASTNPGWVRVDGAYLRFVEGGLFFGVGHNNGWQFDSLEEPTLADMASRGENLFSFWMATPWAQPSWTSGAEPFWDDRSAIENAEGGIGNYNQAACAYMDYLVDEAETQGVYLLPTIWAHDQLCDTLSGWPQSWANNAYSGLGILAEDFYTTQVASVDTEQWRYQKNFYRYLIARWGYSTALAGWVLVAEIDGTDGYVYNNPEMNTWLAAAGDYFAAGDPYRVNGSGDYPMAVSKVDFVSADAETWDSGLGLHAVDSFDSVTDDVGVAATIAGQTITMRGSGRPSFHSEFGGATSGGATQPTHLHNGIWAGAATGAAMTPLVWCDDGGWPMLTDAMRDQLEYLSEFMAGVTWLGDADMEDALPEIKDTFDVVDADYNAWGMKIPDKGYAWIQNTTGTISGTGLQLRTLTVTGLDSGIYDVDWYDVWASGATPLAASGTVTVAGDGILTADIPELTEADIACKFTWSGPTYVLMGAMSVRSVGVGVLVEWTTESEVDNLGFHILRRPGVGGKWERVTASLVPGRLTAVGAEDYRCLDLLLNLRGPGRYEYRIETVSTEGRVKRYGSRRTMTVTVCPEDLALSLLEAPGLVAQRTAKAYGRWQARALAGARARQLSRGAPAEPAQRAAGSEARGETARLLASTAGLLRGRGIGRRRGQRDVRPSPGDVRVRTRGDGIFFVPASALPCPPESAGLVTGGVRSRPLEADPSGIWFFAAEYRDEYTDMNATFIAAGRGTPDPRRALHAPASLFSRDALALVTATARAEEDGRFLMGAGGAPDPWFYPDLLWGGSSEKTVPIDLPDLVAGHVDGPATLRVAVFGFTRDDEVDPDHELIVSVNGAAVADLTWDGRGYVVLEVPLPEGTLREGANTIGLLAPPREEIPRTHGAALDYVEIEYRRRLSVASGPLLLQVDRPGVVEIAGLGRPELRVVEVDETGRGRLVGAAFRAAASALQAVPGYTARFQVSRAGAGGIYYVATPGQVCAPVDVSGAVIVDLGLSEGGFPYERAPARTGEGPARAVYLAVGPERFRWSVKPLLDARYHGGLAPVYVSLESVTDTYGYGRYGAGGIVRLVRELRPRYVLLVGDNSYDYLDRLGTGVDPMVPAVLVRTGGLSQANADALYGDLDCDGTPDVPVGRLPVRTTDELEALVEKIVGRVVACRPRGVLVADARDEGTDFAARQEAVAAGFPGVDWVKLYAGIHGEGASIRRSLTEAVNSGTELVVYQGHGSSFRLGRGATILDVNEAARWTESPLVYLSTCWGAYIQKTTEAAVSMAEVMLRSEEGPAAVIGSTVACSQRNQEALLHDFLAALVREGQCTGDALVSAQRRAAERAAAAMTEEERQAILDTVRCYALLGDPAMPLVPDNPIPQDTP